MSEFQFICIILGLVGFIYGVSKRIDTVVDRMTIAEDDIRRLREIVGLMKGDDE